MTLILAIETSQRLGGVALRDRRQGGETQVEMLSIKKRHDDDLLPAIDRLFSRHGLTPQNLRGGAVGISIGPGGFTGLRIAVATAKMFAELLGTKLIAVPSSLVAAESTTGLNDALVALSSKAESFWATRVSKIHGRWSIVGTPGLATAQTMTLEGVDALLGDEHLPPDVRVACSNRNIPIVEPQFDPRACLAAAERMLATGQTIDPLLLAPRYPREPEAVTLWKKKIASIPGNQ